MYTLAGLSNPETGWGLDGDTFTALSMLRQYGADAWFNLGDRDLATHIRRTQLLGQGRTLSEVTAQLCSALGVTHRIAPMSDQPVRTVLETLPSENWAGGRLSMQEYFVRQRAQPEVSAVHYVGAADAVPSPGMDAALAQAGILVICPSNPALSVQPIVEVSGMKRTAGGLLRPARGGQSHRGQRRRARPCRADNGRAGPGSFRCGRCQGLPGFLRRAGDRPAGRGVGLRSGRRRAASGGHEHDYELAPGPYRLGPDSAVAARIGRDAAHP